MMVTVAVVVATHNLAIGVGVGVLAAMVMFARRVAHFAEVVDVAHPDERHAALRRDGELFFASSNDLVHQFDYAGDPEHVVIDLSGSQIWDSSTVAALDAIETKYRRAARTCKIVGLNEPQPGLAQQARGQLGGRGD